MIEWLTALPIVRNYTIIRVFLFTWRWFCLPHRFLRRDIIFEGVNGDMNASLQTLKTKDTK